MPKSNKAARNSFWRRLFIAPSDSEEQTTDPRPVFMASSIIAVLAGILGWVMASISPGWIVPVCSFAGILFGVLGVRSRLRSVSVVGFVMGMFLLPNAINTILRLIGR